MVVDGEQEPRVGREPVTGAPGRPRRPVGVAVAVGAVLLAGIALAAVLFPAPVGRPIPAASRPVPLAPPARHVFSVSTGLTLVVDVGAAGLVAVDLDRGLARRFTFAGKRDASHLVQVGDRFVFGTVDQPVSVPLSLNGTPQPIGSEPAIDFLPAGETDRVWVLHGTAAAGGRAELAGLAGPAEDPPGAAQPRVTWSPGTATLAAAADSVLAVTPDHDPRLGWLRSGSDAPAPVAAADACVPPLVQERSTVVVAVHGASATCNGVQRLGADGLVPPSVAVPGAVAVRPVAVTPDGGRVLVDGLDALGAELGSWIVDFGTGQVRRVDQLPPASSARAAWSPDGQRLVVLSTHEGRTSLGLYDWRTDRYEAHPVPLDPVGGDAALGQVAAEAVVLVPAGSGPTLGETSAPCVGTGVGELEAPVASGVGLEACLLPGLGDPTPVAPDAPSS